jgi:hypothetical protein
MRFITSTFNQVGKTTRTLIFIPTYVESFDWVFSHENDYLTYQYFCKFVAFLIKHRDIFTNKFVFQFVDHIGILQRHD